MSAMPDVIPVSDLRGDAAGVIKRAAAPSEPPSESESDVSHDRDDVLSEARALLAKEIF